jgi:hypothetical protein
MRCATSVRPVTTSFIIAIERLVASDADQDQLAGWVEIVRAW